MKTSYQKQGALSAHASCGKLKDTEKITKDDVKRYQKSVKNNVSNIKAILKDLGMQKQPPIALYKKILSQSSEQVAHKWVSGRKYYRTYFIEQAFGKSYKAKHIQLSLCIDAMVNILDDLLDEALDEKSKTQYVIEFLRIFSIYNSKHIPEKIRDSLREYFNELITLAMAENFYQQQVAKQKDAKKIILTSVDLLLCRGMDIDVFVDVALLTFKGKKVASYIKEMSRIFRALNILKKDIKDIEHDRKNHIDTLVTLALKQKKKISFSDYIEGVLELLSKKADSLIQSADRLKVKDDTLTPLCRFHMMIQQEKKEILELI